MNAYNIAEQMNKAETRAHTGYTLTPVSETKIDMGSEYSARSFPSDFDVYEGGGYVVGYPHVIGCGIHFRYAGGSFAEIAE